jgi:hypothetical protein
VQADTGGDHQRQGPCLAADLRGQLGGGGGAGARRAVGGRPAATDPAVVMHKTGQTDRQAHGQGAAPGSDVPHS